jgi:hypothetical protein
VLYKIKSPRKEDQVSLIASLKKLAKMDVQNTRIPQTNKIMLRFNLNSNGKVVWSKVVDPPLKSLEVCISKALLQMQSPPAGNTLSRVTILLEARIDHLLAP